MSGPTEVQRYRENGTFVRGIPYIRQVKRYLIINNNFLHASRQYSFRTEVSRTPNNSRNGASEGLDASELLVRCLGTIYSCFACSLHR